MAWRDLTPTPVIVSRRSYAEQRTQDNRTQMRLRFAVTLEYRGVTYARAKVLCTPGVAYDNGTFESGMAPIGAGGWTVSHIYDYAVTGWTNGSGLLAFVEPAL